ncbi:Franean1_4349 family RiPP [Chloroflexota bacterium]
MTVTVVMTDVERLMGRAILDEAFRNQLFTDPEAAIREAGLNLSEAEMTHLKTTLEQIKQTQTIEQLDHQFEGDLQLARW